MRLAGDRRTSDLKPDPLARSISLGLTFARATDGADKEDAHYGAGALGDVEPTHWDQRHAAGQGRDVTHAPKSASAGPEGA